MDVTYIARYRPCANEISSSHTAACGGVVGELLVGRPVQVSQIACRELIALLVPYILGIICQWRRVQEDRCPIGYENED